MVRQVEQRGPLTDPGGQVDEATQHSKPRPDVVEALLGMVVDLWQQGLGLGASRSCELLLGFGGVPFDRHQPRCHVDVECLDGSNQLAFFKGEAMTPRGLVLERFEGDEDLVGNLGGTGWELEGLGLGSGGRQDHPDPRIPMNQQGVPEVSEGSGSTGG